MIYSYQVHSRNGELVVWYTRQLKEEAEKLAAEIGGTITPITMRLHWEGTCPGYSLRTQASLNQFSINPASRFFRCVAEQRSAA